MKFGFAIPSCGRAATISTPRLFPPNMPYYVVVHDENDAKWYRKNPLLSSAQIKVSHAPSGNANQKNWIIENLVDENAWICILDDNIISLNKVHSPFYEKEKVDVWSLGTKFWNKVYRSEPSWEELIAALEESIEKAESIGAKLIGFASNDNPRFRECKWQDYGFCKGKMILVKKSHLRWHPDFTAKEDYEFTAKNLLAFGVILRNDYLYPVAKSGQVGGIGPHRFRMKISIDQAAKLVEMYPQLLRINEVRKPIGSELLFIQRKQLSFA